MKLIDLDNWENVSNKKWDKNRLFEKVLEEQEEFNKAFLNKDDDNMIEEFYDCIQSMLSLIDYCNLAQLLENGKNKHYDKLKSRGHKFK